MKNSIPANWFIAHRCIDISEGFGTTLLGDHIKTSAAKENTLDSMKARFAAGFGIETDLRADYRTEENGILITHNPPQKGENPPRLAEIFALYQEASTNGCLALNIKDAGLQNRLKPLLTQYNITNYFTFDGANPDVLVDAQFGIQAFGRESEIEPFYAAHPKHPIANYPTIAGVWLDNFEARYWITTEIIERHFKNGKDVAIVSPDLHPWSRADKGEMVLSYWSKYRNSIQTLRDKYPDRRMMLCTKMPTAALQFFNEE